MLKCSASFVLGGCYNGDCCLLDGDIILVVIIPSLGRCQPYALSLLAVRLTAISRSPSRYYWLTEPLSAYKKRHGADDVMSFMFIGGVASGCL
jgi:hypothetical protein